MKTDLYDRLFTRVEVAPQPVKIRLGEPLLAIGSCFASNISMSLKELGYQIDSYPLGALYNPLSIHDALNSLLKGAPRDLLLSEQQGQWVSLKHGGSMSRDRDREQLTYRLYQQEERLQKALKEARWLLITWGTAWVYRWQATGEVVANCQKLPEKLFLRELLSLEQLISGWKELLDELWRYNPSLQIISTVSPIRHLKDGAEGNQRSKARLILFQELFESLSPEKIHYFPSYEIMLDELRDYRFYQEDLKHPSREAIGWIMDRFRTAFLHTEDAPACKAYQAMKKQLEHRSLQHDPIEAQLRQEQLGAQLSALAQRHPELDLSSLYELLDQNSPTTL